MVAPGLFCADLQEGPQSGAGLSDGRLTTTTTSSSLPRTPSAQGRSLTGHLVMSSGQMWAPLEAGSSQVLEAEVRMGKMRCWGT
jgi:hypothetical protein